MTVNDLEKRAQQRQRELAKEVRTRWAALPESERAIVDAYIDDTRTETVSERQRWFARSYFVLDDAHPTAEAWVTPRLAEHHARREAWARRQHEESVQREEERRVRGAAAREAYVRKLEEMRAAIARGEPVPARYRPVGGHCAICGKPLQDPESVRLGIGPDCRRRLQRDAQRTHRRSTEDSDAVTR